MQIPIALIGAGIWAREEHAPAIEAADGLLLKAIYSRSITSARSISEAISHPVDLYSEDTEKGYDDILRRSDIAAVVISLPIANQMPFIKAALLAGKHVLSEKPVAENIKDAEDLIRCYHFGAEQVKGLGRITGFQGRQHGMVPQDWKFNLTEWRRSPTHQGGYLLDGGVHYMAGMRLLLSSQPGHEIQMLPALTNQIQPYLPPVDTADVILKTKSGVTGVFQISRGTQLLADEWTVACEKGWIKVENEKVTVSRDGKIEEITVPNERTGVPPEICAWAASLAAGKLRPEQEPEAALADLELIELILKSGQQGGVPMECQHQMVSL
ncbi:oxidoreductase family, NAD-binding Rossmann fold protein [Colletotrichum camelliae]|nr:oxidoreductase family, NAD-binding Rossmann fold protein [Colletotrichum camelliae]